jgi:hypothetical protein
VEVHAVHAGDQCRRNPDHGHDREHLEDFILLGIDKDENCAQQKLRPTGQMRFEIDERGQILLCPRQVSTKSAGPTSGSLRTHSIGGSEIPARMGDECTIAGMVDGLNRRDPLDEWGVVAVDVLDQFGLGVRRTGDQYCAGAADCTDHVLKEGVIFGGMPAADRVGFVMNVSSGMFRMHDDFVNIRRVEMKHSRFMVIDPDGRVIVVRQEVLRNGKFQGKESKLRRPRVQTKYAPRNAYVGSIPSGYTGRMTEAFERVRCGRPDLRP